MRKLLASSTGKIDFTPADLVRTRARLAAEGSSLAVAGLSPEVEAAAQGLMQVEAAVQRLMQVEATVQRLKQADLPS